VTTIAWRLGHLTSGCEGRWHRTFGDRDRDPADLVDFTPSAALALERLWLLVERWRDSVAAMTDEQLDTPGFGQYPWGAGPGDPVHRHRLVDQPRADPPPGRVRPAP
jgi:DinB superfamily